MYRISILALVILSLAAFTHDAQAQNYKIKQRTMLSAGGMAVESTVYVRGQRKRTENGGVMGMGGDVADIEQCDLRQNVKLNDKKRLYLIEPFDDGSPTTSTTTRPATPVVSQPVTKGGTVTMTMNTVDTGERKQINGFTARRVKSTMTSESSPDACTKQNMKIETDGWYIDLPEFVCPVNIRQEIPEFEQPAQGGCRDKYVVRSSGSGKKGFALSETMTFAMGGETFTQTRETVEVSKTALDPALFEVPATYRAAKDASELQGNIDVAAMIKAAEGQDASPGTPTVQRSSGPPAKAAGAIRIGVLMPVNKTTEDLSPSALQSQFASLLTSGKVEAVPIARESDAAALGCDYVVTSEVTKMKQSTGGKIGGFLGKVTNTSIGASSPFEAQVDYVMTKVADGKVVAKNKAAKKADGPAEKAAGSVLEIAAAALIPAAK